jgi:protein SCO1/2
MVVALVMALGGLSCGTGTSAETGDLRGVALVPPMPEPDVTLTSTDGRPFSVRAETAGKVGLLFFGYTHCPDVCPVHMAAIAAALHAVPLDVAARTRVIFVTVDPARDRPARLRAWLDNFDPSFVGLRGSLADVNRVQTALRLVPVVVETTPDSTYQVGHSAAVIAVIGDSARVAYPFGTREVDWLHDLPKLVAMIPPGPKS